MGLSVTDIINWISSLSSIISAAALVITIHYYRKQTSGLEKQLEEMKRQNSILGQQLEEMRKKAKLRGEFDYTFLDKSVPLIGAVTDNLGNVIKTLKQGDAKIIRISVFNEGPVTAKECIPKVRIFRNNGWEGFGGVMLHWIRYRELIHGTRIEDLYRPIDIAVKDNEIADLVFIIKTAKENFAAIRTDLGLDMQFADPRIRLNKDDILKVSVYCDNAMLDLPCIHVKKVPDYDTINSSNEKDFLEILECHKVLPS
ncbi:MAG: hypothetical protein QW699_00190 [Metallosphaera sp.]|uniref:hypothetical protein n=1 Tax=Saccharolobus sp. TaxID=2100761 RepID=UPI002411A12F|nr:hypothetical protein [Candidatus Parvarchaeum tengchongense]MCW1297584.1 hypothetical protein [Candidatus Rehaiarchaeum fermentans]